MVPVWLVYSLFSMDLFYFMQVNPGMILGGYFQYSKYDILKTIAEEHRAKSFYFPKKPDKNDFWEAVLSLPFIYKPNVGERGRGVRLFRTKAEFDRFYPTINEAFILQEYCDFPIELGVLCHKFPNQKLKVTSVVKKEFLMVYGNGKDTLRELANQHARAENRLEYLAEKFGERWYAIVPDGEVVVLEEIGNHCRGTKFLDANELINDKLNEVFDRIVTEVPGFHYGRFDLKVKSLEDLYACRNIRIFELNGINSEAAHIYDPKHTIFYAYKAVFNEYKIVYSLARQVKKTGIPLPDRKSEFARSLSKRLKMKS